MNAAQTRLLLEMEFEFYRLGVSKPEFEKALIRNGFIANPSLVKLDNDSLKRLLLKLRNEVRTGRL